MYFFECNHRFFLIKKRGLDESYIFVTIKRIGKCGTTRDFCDYITQRIPTYNKKIDLITHYRIKNVENICDELGNV